jgi:DNA-binding transcriptional LysR family regulator
LAARFAEEIVSLERRFSGQDLRPTGTVRITTTDTVSGLLLRHLPGLRSAHPEIKLEIAISDAMANLTRREADIAIRPTPEPPEILVGRRIAEVAHAIYASPNYLSRHRGNALLAQDWIGLDDALAGTVIGQWLRENVPETQLTCRLNTLLALRDAALSGIGLALLPCYVGDVTRGLRRAVQKAVPQRSALWLLTHDDLKRTARIRAVMDFLGKALASDRALLEGRQTAGAGPRGPMSRRSPSG